MKISVITLFPEMFDKVFNQSMLWKAQDKKLVEFELIDLRQFGLGPRRQVDEATHDARSSCSQPSAPKEPAVKRPRFRS